MVKHHVELSAGDREQLQAMVRQTSLSVQVWQRAQGLLALDAGRTLQSVAQELGVCYITVGKWRDRYQQEGVAMLHDKARSGRPPRIDGEQRAKVTALACSTPPEGYARWSVRLLADKVVELGLVEEISHDSVHRILKKTNCNRT